MLVVGLKGATEVMIVGSRDGKDVGESAEVVIVVLLAGAVSDTLTLMPVLRLVKKRIMLGPLLVLPTLWQTV